MSSSELTKPRRHVAPAVGGDLPALQLDDIKAESEAALSARGAAYAREYVRIEGDATILLKNIATVVIALRRQYDDVRGRKHEYREAVSEMYRAAGIDADSVSRVQTAVRYHVGNLLRLAYTPAELEAADLQTASFLERQQESRAVSSAIVRAARVSSDVATSTPKPAKGAEEAATGQPVKATADHLRLVEVSKDILGKLDRTVIKKHMTDGQRAKLDRELAAMERKIASLRKLTQKPSSDA